MRVVVEEEQELPPDVRGTDVAALRDADVLRQLDRTDARRHLLRHDAVADHDHVQVDALLG
ncbi:hypothetical protein [Streptomyces bauhiniae]